VDELGGEMKKSTLNKIIIVLVSIAFISFFLQLGYFIEIRSDIVLRLLGPIFALSIMLLLFLGLIKSKGWVLSSICIIGMILFGIFGLLSSMLYDPPKEDKAIFQNNSGAFIIFQIIPSAAWGVDHSRIIKTKGKDGFIRFISGIPNDAIPFKILNDNHYLNENMPDEIVYENQRYTLVEKHLR
jgi:hypothetical protein